MAIRTTLGGLVACLLLAGCTTQPGGLTPKGASATKSGKVEGSIKIVGSDTMLNLNTRWAEGFKKKYPAVTIEVEGKGSGSAPPALIGGNTTFGAMSRDMEPKEVDAFKAKFGYPPTRLTVATDLLAVYVHKDNPIPSLTFAQLDAIFGKKRLAGHPTDIATWGDLGLEGDWAKQPISLYGRDSASGTAKYFAEAVMQKGGDYKDTVKPQPGSSGVVSSVAKDKYGIGYSGIGYKSADVRAVPLTKDTKPAAEPTEANARAGKYPLARDLYLFLNYKEGEELDPLRLAFLKYVYSEEGRKDVEDDGYLKLDPAEADRALEAVGLR